LIQAGDVSKAYVMSQEKGRHKARAFIFESMALAAETL
jgi:hypothetical protein